MAKKITGWLIDPEAKIVSPVSTTDDLDSLYALLDCSLVEPFRLGPPDNGQSLVLILDEEGRLRKDRRAFILGGMVFFGKALLCAMGRNWIESIPVVAPPPVEFPD